MEAEEGEPAATQRVYDQAQIAYSAQVLGDRALAAWSARGADNRLYRAVTDAALCAAVPRRGGDKAP